MTPNPCSFWLDVLRRFAEMSFVSVIRTRKIATTFGPLGRLSSEPAECLLLALLGFDDQFAFEGKADISDPMVSTSASGT